MVGIVQALIRANAKAIGLRGFEFCTVLTVLGSYAVTFAAKPKVLEAARPAAFPRVAKRMQVLMPFDQPSQNTFFSTIN